MRYAAIVEVGVEGHYCAVKFLTRAAADAWAEKNDAEIMAWAPMMSLADAVELSKYRTSDQTSGSER